MVAALSHESCSLNGEMIETRGGEVRRLFITLRVRQEDLRLLEETRNEIHRIEKIVIGRAQAGLVSKYDVERIREVYMNKGYLNVQVGLPSIELTEDKQWFIVTFVVEEGEPYTIGEIGFRGNTVFEEAELRSGSDIRVGEVFQRLRAAGVDWKRILTLIGPILQILLSGGGWDQVLAAILALFFPPAPPLTPPPLPGA